MAGPRRVHRVETVDDMVSSWRSASCCSSVEVLEVAEAHEARCQARDHAGLDRFADDRVVGARHRKSAVVGMPRPCIASDARNSRIEERSTPGVAHAGVRRLARPLS